MDWISQSFQQLFQQQLETAQKTTIHKKMKVTLVAVLCLVASVVAYPGGYGYGSGASGAYGAGAGAYGAGAGAYGAGAGAYGAGAYDAGNVNSYSRQNHYGHDFGHDVSAPHYGNYHGRQESGSGDSVKGSYYLREADGSLRRVDYVADHPGGFRATITDKTGTKTYGYDQGYPSAYGSGAPQHY